MHVALAQAVKGGGPMTRWWLCLCCSCVTVHVTPLGGSEEHLGWCMSFSQFVLMDIFPAVSGWRGACLTMSVKKNGSLLGVGFGVLAIPLLEIAPSCPPGMGHLLPPPVVPAALHSGVLPMPFSVPWGQGHSNSSLSC